VPAHDVPVRERWRRATAALALTLGLFCVLWEMWLAPIRPSGSWLALKAVPLLLLSPAVARGNVKSTQWLLLLLPAYLSEGLVRSFSEAGRYAACAYLETVLSVCALVCGVRYLKARAATA
jgi:uncharacterized membrane protein